MITPKIKQKKTRAKTIYEKRKLAKKKRNCNHKKVIAKTKNCLYVNDDQKKTKIFLYSYGVMKRVKLLL